MAVGLGTRQAADEEARAEVEVRIISADGLTNYTDICQLLEGVWWSLATDGIVKERIADVHQVLNSRLEKTRILNTKLSASLSRLELSGKSVQEAIGPIYGNTQKLQVLGTST